MKKIAITIVTVIFLLATSSASANFLCYKLFGGERICLSTNTNVRDVRVGLS
jgi:hypothetical protein